MTEIESCVGKAKGVQLGREQHAYTSIVSKSRGETRQVSEVYISGGMREMGRFPRFWGLDRISSTTKDTRDTKGFNAKGATDAKVGTVSLQSRHE